MAAPILVIDPDPAMRRLLEWNLGNAGYGATCVSSAEHALASIDGALPDIVLLEWDLPGQSGEALIRCLRARPRTRALPIIMVSARAGEHDAIQALDSGADDYLRKPFGPRELLARMHAVLRRRAPAALPDAVQMAGLRLEPSTQRATAGTSALALGPIEFRLLNFLMHHPERVHTRPQLLDEVWGRHAVLEERTVDTHVGRLRSALQPSGHQAHIETVRGIGYRFVLRRGASGADRAGAR